MSSGLWKRIQNIITGGMGKSAQPTEEEEIVNACCDQPEVHIAYRGKSDDRMYIAYNRKWQEVRYYQPHGLRVFCKVCRRRVY